MIKRLPDIYFTPKYGKLYENIENGKLEEFYFENDIGSVYYQFIKRPIDETVDGRTYFDITTPYGYGGPVILELNENSSKEKLIKEYLEMFEIYCEEKHIVSEFIRFHPIIKNHIDFQKDYDVQYMRKTLGTNLKDYNDPIQSEFNKSSRKVIRRALRSGVTYDIEKSPKDIDEFIYIYNSTMDRNDANDYYYFGNKYFYDIMQNFKENIILVKVKFNEKTIASGLYLLHDKTIHIHLSGTLDEYLYLSPAYILRYSITLWGKENGYELIHHGGGRSNSEDDTLFTFKKRFAKNTEFNFYIGKKIWNNSIYSKLSKLKANNKNTEFFPAYRSSI